MVAGKQEKRTKNKTKKQSNQIQGFWFYLAPYHMQSEYEARFTSHRKKNWITKLVKCCNFIVFQVRIHQFYHKENTSSLYYCNDCKMR